MASDPGRKLRVLALLGAVTGASLMTGGSALAAPTVKPCTPDGAGGDPQSCQTESFPLRPPASAPALPPGPGPIPPYAS